MTPRVPRLVEGSRFSSPWLLPSYHARPQSSSTFKRFSGGHVATELTLEQMRLFVKEHFEVFVNKRNAAIIRTNMTPDFLDHDGPGGKPTGVEGDEQMMVAMFKAMPDLHVTVEDLIAEGDKVMCRNVWRWTDATSGKRMAFRGFVLWRFEGTKIAERWATVTSPAPET
jgi:predicted ester cyclase